MNVMGHRGPAEASGRDRGEGTEIEMIREVDVVRGNSIASAAKSLGLDGHQQYSRWAIRGKDQWR